MLLESERDRLKQQRGISHPFRSGNFHMMPLDGPRVVIDGAELVEDYIIKGMAMSMVLFRIGVFIPLVIQLPLIFLI
jgi:hypothetical protein